MSVEICSASENHVPRSYSVVRDSNFGSQEAPIFNFHLFLPNKFSGAYKTYLTAASLHYCIPQARPKQTLQSDLRHISAR